MVNLTLSQLCGLYPQLKAIEAEFPSSLEVEGVYSLEKGKIPKDELIGWLYSRVWLKLANLSVFVHPDPSKTVATKRAPVVPASLVVQPVKAWQGEKVPFSAAQRLVEIGLCYALEKVYGAGGVRLFLSLREALERVEVKFSD
jgi:hypothetical protein